ncbi:MAG: hypothetical protein ACR2QW_13685 [bacterium]
MNAVLSRFADNPIIGKIVTWPPGRHKIKMMRGSLPILRKPFIEVEYENGQIQSFSFSKHGFAEFWAEAVVILETVTDIEIVSEINFPPLDTRSDLVEQLLADKQECISDSVEMFDADMFALFLDQFGKNCKDLPDDLKQKIDKAYIQSCS